MSGGRRRDRGGLRRAAAAVRGVRDVRDAVRGAVHRGHRADEGSCGRQPSVTFDGEFCQLSGRRDGAQAVPEAVSAAVVRRVGRGRGAARRCGCATGSSAPGRSTTAAFAGAGGRGAVGARGRGRRRGSATASSRSRSGSTSGSTRPTGPGAGADERRARRASTGSGCRPSRRRRWRARWSSAWRRVRAVDRRGSGDDPVHAAVRRAGAHGADRRGGHPRGSADGCGWPRAQHAQRVPDRLGLQDAEHALEARLGRPVRGWEADHPLEVAPRRPPRGRRRARRARRPGRSRSRPVRGQPGGDLGDLGR